MSKKRKAEVEVKSHEVTKSVTKDGKISSVTAKEKVNSNQSGPTKLEMLLERSNKKKKVESEDTKEVKGKKAIPSIDDIFSSGIKDRDRKREEDEKEREKERKERERLEKIREQDLAEDGDEHYVGMVKNPKVHRYDEATGLHIYKFYHLGMKQNDGGTRDCPFDCSCCY